MLNEKTDLTPGGSELWFDPHRGSEKTFLKALGELGRQIGSPRAGDGSLGSGDTRAAASGLM